MEYVFVGKINKEIKIVTILMKTWGGVVYVADIIFQYDHWVSPKS